MPRLTKDQWEEARAMRETGSTLTAVAAHFGIDRAGVSRRAKAENWSDGSDVSEVIRRKVTERAHGIVTSGDAKKRNEAINKAVDKAAEVVLRHKAEWQEHRSLFGVSEIKSDFNTGKSAKISAEMLMIRQKAERVAWGLDTQESKQSITIERSY